MLVDGPFAAAPPFAAPPFLSRCRRLDWQLPGLTCLEADFNPDRFSEGLFEQLAVAPAASIANAIAKRRAEFLAGRYLAQQCLTRMGCGVRQLPVGADRAPVWPTGIIGSISHCQNRAVAVTAAQQNYLGVGIDIEPYITAALADSLLPQLIQPGEIDALQLSGLPFEQWATLAFSAKESFFKLAYPRVGYYFDFACVEIGRVDLTEHTFVVTVRRPLAQAFAAGDAMTGHFHLKKQHLLTLIAQPAD